MIPLSAGSSASAFGNSVDVGTECGEIRGALLSSARRSWNRVRVLSFTGNEQFHVPALTALDNSGMLSSGRRSFGLCLTQKCVPGFDFRENVQVIAEGADFDYRRLAQNTVAVCVPTALANWHSVADPAIQLIGRGRDDAR